MNNAFYIAAAGSGKTTFLINEALKKDASVLITTYTISNKDEIKTKIINKLGYVPSNIEIQTWYDFLLANGVRPYKGAMDDGLYKEHIGFTFSNGISGLKCTMKNGTPVYYSEEEIYNHYFTKNIKIFSDKTSKFTVKCNDRIGNKIIERINKIFAYIFIDEAQDLTGYDLDIIKLLFKSSSEIILVGDPRQTVYLTHQSKKYIKYQYGNIRSFFENELGKKISCTIDEEILNASHRNNQYICNYSTKLYQNMKRTNACKCTECRTYDIDHEGIFIIKEDDIANYLEKYMPVQLRPDKTVSCDDRFPAHNFGESKGLTFNRVLIHPTKTMTAWIKDNSKPLADMTRAKLYVAITRARFSVGIIINYSNKDINTHGYCFNDELLIPYNPDEGVR
ncbi:UvrD-helicase domain-containing protein [Treponema primitia]|uniref:UvrD-helicase domain-containing protein n=1 Tax=Treponema primitia TaxID=88058 RepID=UPI0002554C04|nr:UvrD-helicase domain-containing protein [Treponema primitia]